MIPKSYGELEERIGYRFHSPELIQTALTHSSFANEQRARQKDVACNERLEFLGDSVLSIIVSEHIFNQFVDLPEGELTKLRAAVVQSSSLASYARKIGLGEFLFLGRGEEKTHGRDRQSTLENAFEALLGAMYLDASPNGKTVVSAFLLPFIEEELKLTGDFGRHIDYKTELQQLIQQAEGDYLEYVLVGESGPDHSKIFESEARLNSNVIGRGKGKTKRESEQNAAREALTLFGEIKQ